MYRNPEAPKLILNTLADKAREVQYFANRFERERNRDLHKLHNEEIQKLYRVSGEDRFIKLADRMSDCANWMQYRISTDPVSGEVTPKISAASFCRVRQCPVCQERRASKWRARFYDALPKIREDYPQAKWVFLTFTQKNCPPENLRDEIKRINNAVTKLKRRKDWPALGYIKSIEVTFNKEKEEAHPHAHLLMMVPPSYFGRGYIKHSQWQEMWQIAMGLDYKPVVSVQRVKPYNGVDSQDYLSDAILETMKYTVKSQDLVSSPYWLYSFTDQIKGTRAISVSGVLSKYFSKDFLANPDDYLDETDGHTHIEEIVDVTWRANPEVPKYGRLVPIGRASNLVRLSPRQNSLGQILKFKSFPPPPEKVIPLRL
jgi:plasmid rolling circle replication initiator protein Rep